MLFTEGVVMAKQGRGSEQAMIRLPDGMRDQLKSVAARNGRSMNAEIVDRLEQSFRVWPKVDIPVDLYERARRARNFQRTDIEKEISKAAIEIIQRALPTSGALHRDLLTIVFQVLQKAPDGKREELKARFDDLLKDVFTDTDDRKMEPEI
jgi:plasmid stability protein